MSGSSTCSSSTPEHPCRARACVHTASPAPVRVRTRAWGGIPRAERLRHSGHACLVGACGGAPRAERLRHNARASVRLGARCVRAAHVRGHAPCSMQH
eukprot:7400546-Alexandrium_andersonii.AAC.1